MVFERKNSQLTSAHKTWRFSQLLDLPSVRHILCRISRAMLSESEVLEPCNRLTPRRALFLSRVSRSRICFKTPTSSSSTLCWIPLDVSMNLQSLDAANALPSAYRHSITSKSITTILIRCSRTMVYKELRKRFIFNKVHKQILTTTRRDFVLNIFKYFNNTHHGLILQLGMIMLTKAAYSLH